MTIHKLVGRREILYYDAKYRSLCGQPGETAYFWKHVTCEACLKFKPKPPEEY
jgi:hypothetical protein